LTRTRLFLASAVLAPTCFAATFAGVEIPEAAKELIYRYGSDTRTIDYFTVTSESMLPPEEPTDEELAAYLTDRQSEFRTMPTRAIDLMVLSPEAIAPGIEVTEEDVAAEYERTKANYQRAETRHVRQLVLSAEGLVRRAVARFRSFMPLRGLERGLAAQLGGADRGCGQRSIEGAAEELTAGPHHLGSASGGLG